MTKFDYPNTYCFDRSDFSESNKQITHKKYNTKMATYTVLNYDKKTVFKYDNIISKYRSVIFDDASNNILCFTPPKSIPIDQFIANNPTINEDIMISETIEGTMISLFYDPHINSWEIATKSAVGGDYFYYRTEYTRDMLSDQPKFRNMFMDAMQADRNSDINDIHGISSLPKNYTYNFILQHPENHMVLTVQQATLYLISVYDTVIDIAGGPPYHDYGVRQIHDNYLQLFQEMGNFIHFPKIYFADSYEEVMVKFASIHCDYRHMGIMLINKKTGERASVKNPVYEDVRKLRGNNPNLQYHYLCLRNMGKVKEFVGFFPQYNKLFFEFYDQYMDFVKNVHKSYMSYYVLKTGEEISKKYIHHIYKLHHKVYLPSLSKKTTIDISGNEVVIPPSKIVITKKVVCEYMDNIEPGEMLYYLNYDRRQYSINQLGQSPQPDVVNNDLSS